MDSRPVTLIVRLWPRQDGVIVELCPLQGGEVRLFLKLEELCRHLETVQARGRTEKEGGEV
jgi:hypothetical protein